RSRGNLASPRLCSNDYRNDAGLSGHVSFVSTASRQRSLGASGIDGEIAAPGRLSLCLLDIGSHPARSRFRWLLSKLSRVWHMGVNYQFASAVDWISPVCLPGSCPYEHGLCLHEVSLGSRCNGRIPNWADRLKDRSPSCLGKEQALGKWLDPKQARP